MKGSAEKRGKSGVFPFAKRPGTKKKIKLVPKSWLRLELEGEKRWNWKVQQGRTEKKDSQDFCLVGLCRFEWGPSYEGE